MTQTHTVRLACGTIGEVTTGLKPKELLGRYAMASATMSIARMASCIEYVQAWAAQNNVIFKG